MKKTNLALIALASLTLFSCSTSVPVAGNVDNGKESFYGMATKKLTSNSGTIHMTSNKGAECDGDFNYFPDSTAGKGRFHCKDGRTGQYTFDTVGHEGNGVGTTSNGENIDFTFNKVSSRNL